VASLSERLTAQFYDWEKLGRGWCTFETPVDLEPDFYPFFFHVSPPQTKIIDDGKVPNIFGRIANMFSKPPEPQEEEEDQESIPVNAYVFNCHEALTIYSLILPKEHKVDIQETEQLLLMLSYCRYPVSFEIIGSHQRISLQLVCRESDAYHVQSQLKAYFPDCIIQERKDLMDELVEHARAGCVVDYGLRDEFICPIAMAENFKLDPFIGLFASLEHLQEKEYAVIQVLFKGAINPWAESILRSVTDKEGKPFFADAPDMLPLAKKKVAFPLFAVGIKIMGAGRYMDRAVQITDGVGKSLVRIFTNSGNALIPLYSNEAIYSFELKASDIFRRESHRVGMLLNSRELATLVHLPSESVNSQILERIARKTKAAPSITEGHKLILGSNEHQGKAKEVTVSASQRLRHIHIIGATGTGKSTMILSMIRQDIRLANGVAVLDPHGDLIENILPHIPFNRRKDVLIIDPSDRDYPVGFNFLTAHSEIEKDILSSDLVAVFKRLSTSWGDQMNSVLANAILAFLESSTGGTMVDLRRFLVEKTFRDTFLKTVSDPSIKYYWQKEYPLLKSNSIGSILTRLDTFLRPKLIRNMVAQKKGLDFESILDTQKILLIKLSQGLIGNENSYLLGTVIVSKIHQAAMARQAKEERKDFFIYIDEFQNFITPSMSAILSGARKYHVGLVLAHQDMQQLVKYDSELASAVVSNAGTRICFRLGDVDARRFDSGFSFFDASDLENLGIGEAIARVERPDYDFSLQTIPVPTIEQAEAEQIKADVISRSRQTHGTPREEVEAQLQELIAEPEENIQPVKNEPAQTSPSATSEPSTTPRPSTAQQEIKPIPLEVQKETFEKLIKHKEESQHRYLQNLIKRMSESRGYKAIIEEPTSDGKGRVDVHLDRNGKKIAVEVCVTTEIDWEIHNIEKCLQSGYDLVVECSNDKKTLHALKKKIEGVFKDELKKKILVFEPEHLFQFLDMEVARDATTEVKVKGYRVKIEYNPDPHAETKRDAVSRTVFDAANKKKKK